MRSISEVGLGGSSPPAIVGCRVEGSGFRVEGLGSGVMSAFRHLSSKGATNQKNMVHRIFEEHILDGYIGLLYGDTWIV